MLVTNKVISVFSPTGGLGCTTVAVHLAYALAKTTETAVADFVLDFGRVSDYLRFSPKIAVDKIAGTMILNQSSSFEALSFPRRSKLKVLAAPSGLAQPFDVKQLLNDCRNVFKLTVVDLPHSRMCPQVNQALEASDYILLVGEYGWNSIIHSATFGELKDSRHHPWSQKTRLVINKVEWLPADVLAECRKNLQIPVSVELPLTEGLIDAGGDKLLGRRNSFTLNIGKLARLVEGL